MSTARPWSPHLIQRSTTKGITTLKRRDIFIFVARPDTGDQARKYLGEWLRFLDGHPGYLGGSVLEEVAVELLP